MMLGRRPHQRGLALVVLLRVYIGSMVQQNLDGVRVASAGGGHQHGLTVLRRQGLGIRAGLEQRFDHRRVAQSRGFGERRRAIAIRGLRIGSGLQQQFDSVQIVPMSRPMQRSSAVRLRRVHVGVLLYQRAQRLHVAILSGVGGIGARGIAGDGQAQRWKVWW